MADGLHFCIRTPHGLVLDADVCSVRVPTETGLVGLRPGGEPLVLAVEPGLVVLRKAHGGAFAATAGGLLEADRARCTLYTPFAAAGESEQEMSTILDQLRQTPPAELVARRRIEELEQRIVNELTVRPRRARRMGHHG